MTRDDYKSAAIAIGEVASARNLIENAQDLVQYNFGDGYNGDFNKAWTVLNEIIFALNERLDQETVDTEEGEE